MKRVLSLLIIIFSCIFISACSQAKDVVSSENVLHVLKENNMTVYNNTKNFPFASAAYFVDSPYVINFVSSNDKVKVKAMFLDECDNIEKKVGTSEHEQHVEKGKNYDTYYEKTEHYFYYVSYVDGSYITITGKDNDKKDILKLASELGF